MNLKLKHSCGHSWIECVDCGYTQPVDWMPERSLVALLTAGGSRPIDEFVKRELEKNNEKRRKGFAIASRHKCR